MKFLDSNGCKPDSTNSPLSDQEGAMFLLAGILVNQHSLLALSPLQLNLVWGGLSSLLITMVAEYINAFWYGASPSLVRFSLFFPFSYLRLLQGHKPDSPHCSSSSRYLRCITVAGAGHDACPYCTFDWCSFWHGMLGVPVWPRLRRGGGKGSKQVR